MLALTLPSALLALLVVGWRRLAVQGLVLLVADYAWTVAIHIPLVTRLQSLGAIAAGSEWSWLRARYIADDLVRTVFLLAASVSFVVLATLRGQSVGPTGFKPTD
jgi:hypothetical protein